MIRIGREMRFSPGVSQGLLILSTRSLYDFTERVENLTGHTDGFQKVGFTSRIDDLLARIMPVKVHNRFLSINKEISHSSQH